jgi:DEAD/DEAH box helicase domain-containing protein
MRDPVGAFQQIRNLFLTYLDTAFRIDNDELRAERRHLLEQPNVLCAPPLIEPIPLYEPSSALEELLNVHVGPNDEEILAGFSSDQRKAFVDLALSGLIPSTGGPGGSATKKAEYPLYKHQLQSLARGTKRGQPVIVTSGTGSGKTESFLLPILATITQEATGWSRPAYSTRRWWQTKKDGTARRSGFPSKDDPDLNPFVPQRTGEKRNAAVRALIIYPMNALVEDQLVRLRRALDSDEARKSLDEHTQGNRIFFGRYTGATPVTGWNVSPVRALMDSDEEIAREGLRRERKLDELFDAMKDLQEGQAEAEDEAFAEAKNSLEPRLRSVAGSGFRRSMHYSLPFMFPSIDGGEMVSRWDMQAHPPDILITNTTMLSAMLAREVDDPIIRKTRDWITTNDGAYFFLVLDELHLNRGAAGTEVAYLLRILLRRLGLADSKHSHKLRVLCSSASLPTEGALGEESLDYLWGMFGGLGTIRAQGQEPGTRQDWAKAIVAGTQALPVRLRVEKLNPAPFADFLARHITSPEVDAPLPLIAPSQVEPLWRAMHKEFGFVTDAPLDTCLRECVEQASAVLTSACAQAVDKLGPRIRATTIEQVGERVFLDTGQLAERVEQAIRGLLLVRGYGDELKSLFPGTKAHSAQPFRLHVFCRSLEGLFAALAPSPSKGHPFGPLAVERGSRCEQTDLPLFELAYCEPCGEMFFGGRIDPQLASIGKIDLLPTEPRLEGLPDQAASYRFEDLSYETFRLFWPSEAPADPDRDDNGTWETTWLDPSTGHVELDAPQSANYFKLKMWHRDDRLENPRHKRKAGDPGSHLPYACPKCGLSYKGRSTEHRLSPVRSFRTGLEKTTQLLTTELFTVLGGEGFGSRNAKANKTPKLISFSDSRQEAANAALQIERYHCRDVRRAALVSVLASYLDGIPARRAALDAREQEVTASTDLDDDRKDEALGEIKKERRLLDRELRTSTVALSRVLDVGDIVKEGEVKPYLSRLVSLGLHPADETGVDKIRFTPAPTGTERPKPVEKEWNELFTLEANVVHWRTANELKLEAPTIKGLQARISAALLVDLTNVVHGRGYFALEDAGLGYATVPALATRDGAVQPDPEREWCAATIRLFGDRYRFSKSSHPYQSSEEHLSAWLAYDKPEAARMQEKKIWRFAVKAASALRLTPEELLTKVLRRLDENGHIGGRIANEHVSLQLVAPDTPFFRCIKCRRPHLHRGVGICTRCLDVLPPEPSGTAHELRRQSYLAVKAASGEFRLHCEELTGQTEDPARRQRYFRGVLPKDSFRVKDEIDLLTVTTTMEVGIDVGDLQGVVMANMPPQRFNYQQRVGRAGRRRQAFSIALTVCRARNHDLYYFRHPEKITGDDPPPPFLTKDLDVVAARLVRKEWMHEAFASLREETRRSGEKYPTDTARSDIHGEYLPLDQWPLWKESVRQKLLETEVMRDDVIKWVAEFGGPDLTNGGSAKLSVDDILNAIDTIPAECRQEGLAHSLAEAGKLPMYGMPTRVRNLYIYTKDTVTTVARTGKDAWQGSSWVKVDRDASTCASA